MIHACGGQDSDDSAGFGGSAGQMAADAAAIGGGGNHPPPGPADSRPCTPTYCFVYQQALHCIPTYCALMGPTVPSPVARDVK